MKKMHNFILHDDLNHCSHIKYRQTFVRLLPHKECIKSIFTSYFHNYLADNYTHTPYFGETSTAASKRSHRGAPRSAFNPSVQRVPLTASRFPTLDATSATTADTPLMACRAERSALLRICCDSVTLELLTFWVVDIHG